MPFKIGGGKKMQEYDSSTGRYGCETIKITQSYLMSLSILDNLKLVNDRTKTSIVMPNYKNSITPDEKFTKYSLDETHPVGKHKAIVYKKVLGFTKDNYILLKKQLHNAVITGNAKLVNIRKNEYEIIKYEFVVNVKGVNGNNADVIIVYGIGKTSKNPVMLTNYVK